MQEEIQERKPKLITLIQEPEGKTSEIPWPKTVAKLLRNLGLRSTDCLVIHHGRTEEEKPFLLTHDLNIEPGATITIRTVISRG